MCLTNINLIKKKQNMQVKRNKVGAFVQQQLNSNKSRCQAENDPIQKVNLAIKQVTFANIMSQYLRNNSYVFNALMTLAQAYLNCQSYGQALVQARLAKKQVQNQKNGSREKAVLIIVQCLVKQNKFQDAFDILTNLREQDILDKQINKYFELLLNVLVYLGEEQKVSEALVNFQSKIIKIYGKKQCQYGFFLVTKGISLGRFEKYNEAISYINQGLQILIQRKSKEKKEIALIYLKLSEFHRKLNNLQKQYSSLICAYSMARQLQEPQMVLSTLHTIASNLIQRQQYVKALKQLKTAKNLERQMFGQSSSQMAKTIKKIIQILGILNMKAQLKKYEQQYSRIVGSCIPLSNLKQKSMNLQKK